MILKDPPEPRLTGREPGYWQNEIGGTLRPAIIRFVLNCPNEADIPIIRSYFRQWVCATVWTENPHQEETGRAYLAELCARVEHLATIEDLRDFCDCLVYFGMDPL